MFVNRRWPGAARGEIMECGRPRLPPEPGPGPGPGLIQGPVRPELQDDQLMYDMQEHMRQCRCQCNHAGFGNFIHHQVS